MRKILPLLSTLLISIVASGQITTPIIKANFGVDADVSSNYFNSAAQPSNDDWFNNKLYLGTGEFIIDTTGAAAIIAAYATTPSSRLLSFSRLMRQAPYSTVNNRLLLDAIFHRDFHGDDSTVFASGSSKNGMSPGNWSCPPSQNIPDKNDILDAYTHVRRAGPNVTDSLWMFGGVATENTTGSRYFDFELYQTDIYYDRTNQTFNNYGPDAGHTSWKFDAFGNIKSVGDIVFTAEFGSSTLTLVEARIWVDSSSLLITPSTFSWGGAFDGASSGAKYGYASIKPKTAGAFYTGLENTAGGVWAGAFNLVREDNSVVTSYIANQFMEFSVNLSKLGLDPGKTLNNPCGTPFRRVLIKTRASTAFTAELKDFIAPFRMFDYAKVNANAPYVYFCGKMDTTTINVSNPIATSIYTWTTLTGHIIGSNTGTTITIDQPGKYFVTQQLNIQCSQYATDSVEIIYDAVCKLLDVTLTRFDGFKTGNNTELRWQANNNQFASSYALEYSMDNKEFLPLVSVPANSNRGLAAYSFAYPSPVAVNSIVFYRIKIISKNGTVKYSDIISIRSNGSKQTALIFPNPVVNEASLSIASDAKDMADIFILDVFGRTIKQLRITLQSGENIIPLHELPQLPPGMYVVKIKSGNGESTQKVIVQK